MLSVAVRETIGRTSTVSLGLIGQPAPACGDIQKDLPRDQVASSLRHRFSLLGLSAEIFRRQYIRSATISTYNGCVDPDKHRVPSGQESGPVGGNEAVTVYSNLTMHPTSGRVDANVPKTELCAGIDLMREALMDGVG